MMGSMGGEIEFKAYEQHQGEFLLFAQLLQLLERLTRTKVPTDRERCERQF